jgi:hypothetical protein
MSAVKKSSHALSFKINASADVCVCLFPTLRLFARGANFAQKATALRIYEFARTPRLSGLAVNMHGHLRPLPQALPRNRRSLLLMCKQHYWPFLWNTDWQEIYPLCAELWRHSAIGEKTSNGRGIASFPFNCCQQCLLDISNGLPGAQCRRCNGILLHGLFCDFCILYFFAYLRNKIGGRCSG